MHNLYAIEIATKVKLSLNITLIGQNMNDAGKIPRKQAKLLNLSVMKSIIGVAMFASSSFAILPASAANKFKSPEILMLGDSQLSFGAGEVVLDLFQNIEARCEGVVDQKMLLSELQKMRKTLVGARSSSLQSWTTTSGWAYDRLCKKDPTWGVNASIWGDGRPRNTPYVQIGEHKDYQFCKKGKTPMQAMFDAGYNPKLLIFNILGNNAKRWAKNPKSAEIDVAKFIEQTPAHLPCIYMSTLPIHTKRRNTQRYKAQTAIKAAFEKANNRCSFVEILDKKTIKLIQGQNHYFKQKNGKVKDPFHPRKRAASKVYTLKTNEICNAIEKAFIPKVVAMPKLVPAAVVGPPHSVSISASFDDEIRGIIQ